MSVRRWEVPLLKRRRELEGAGKRRKDGPQAADLSVFTEQTGGRRIRRKVILLNYLSKHYGSTVSHSMNLVLIQF